MSFIINVFPNEPIVVTRFWGHTGANEDYPQMLGQLARRLAGKNGPIYRINDFSELDAPTLGDVVVALYLEFRSVVSGTSTDPRIRTVLVTANDLIKRGAQSAQQDQYGYREPSPIFASLGEALSYCRAQIEKDTLQYINQTA